MEIIFYNNYAENVRIDKTDYLSNNFVVKGNLRDECDITSPVITIEDSELRKYFVVTGENNYIYANEQKIIYQDEVNIFSYNYCFIPLFSRYYFITSITNVRTKLWRVSLRCDVLMTYKNTILNYECFISRNEYYYNVHVEDKYLPLEYNKKIEFNNFIDTSNKYPSINIENFNNYSIVLGAITSFSYGLADYVVADRYEPNATLGDIINKYSTIEMGSNGAYFQKLTAGQLKNILNSIIQNDTLATYVVSLIAFPFVKPIIDSFEDTGNDIHIGDTTINTGDDLVFCSSANSLPAMVHKIFKVTRKYNNFLDYAPYTKYEFFIPFVGWREFNPEDILDAELWLVYQVNADTTKGTAMLIDFTNKKVIWNEDCILGMNIPINSTNALEYRNSMVSATIQSIAGIGSGIASMALGGPVGVAVGTGMILGSVSSGISTMCNTYKTGQTQVSNANSGNVVSNNFTIKITYPTIALDNVDKYSKFIGRPLEINTTLNKLKGYTIVGGVHIENLPNATENEKNDIDSLLRKGVII